ncbi:MAG TPA: ABC transporter substrate-binding protein [Candidatus Obscuribacterales bacterium]
MEKLVVFEIGESNLAVGLPVTLRISEEGREILRRTGNLPPAVEVFQHYDNLQNKYYNLPAIRNARIPRLDIPDQQITNVSGEDGEDEQLLENYRQATKDFQVQLQEWLNQPEFLNLRIQVLKQVRSEDTARIIIATKNRKLWKLPWHLWDLFNYDCNSEPAVSTEDYKSPPITYLRNTVKILAIFGNSDGINLDPDRELLSRLETRGAKITWLPQPTRKDLKEQLSGEAWDILFFAGHSYSEGNNGVIQLNQCDRISLWELEQRFKEAVKKGLKLAIFNSCDGLGLAQDLAEVNLPHVIVMREPVPDIVAQRFLEHFLNEFSQGKSSLNEAVRYARTCLHEEETEYGLPCASWLPVVYENPTTPPLIWEQSATQTSEHEDFIKLLTNLIKKIAKSPRRAIALITIFLVTVLILIIVANDRENKFVQKKPNIENPISASVGDRLSEGEKILVKGNSTDEKAEGVKAFKDNNFSLTVEKFAASLQKQKNDPETLIYFNNAKIGNKPALKIAVSVPIGSNINVAQEMLRGVAQAQNEININGGINGKLLKVVIANDDNKEEFAQEIARTFVNKTDILAVVGHNSSDASVAAAPIYNKGGLVMITPTSFSDALASSGEYIFRMVPTIRNFTDTLSNYIIKTAKKKNIAVCSSKSARDNESFTNQFINSFRNEGGQYIRVNCDFDDSNFNPETLISEIINNKADSLLLAPHVDRIDKAVKMAQANKGRLPLFASPTLYTNKTLEQGQQAVNGLVLVTPWASEQLPNSHPFLATAKNLWGGNVNWRTAEAYDTTNLIATGLKKNQTREGLKNTITSPNFSVGGVTGHIEFWRGDRQYVQGNALLVKVQPNKTASDYEFVILPR